MKKRIVRLLALVVAWSSLSMTVLACDPSRDPQDTLDNPPTVTRVDSPYIEKAQATDSNSRKPTEGLDGTNPEDDGFMAPGYGTIKFDKYGIGYSVDSADSNCPYWKSNGGSVYKITEPNFNMDDIRQSSNWKTRGYYVGYYAY